MTDSAPHLLAAGRADLGALHDFEEDLRVEAARLQRFAEGLRAQAETVTGATQRDLWVAFFGMRDAAARLEDAARSIALAKART
jgi:hypothetical protein